MRSSLALSANARTVQSLEKLFPKLSAQGQQKRALSSAASVDTFFDDYAAHVEERKAQGIVPLPLNAEQVAALVEIVKNPPSGRESEIIDLLENRIPPGVDEAAYVKAAFLAAITTGEASSPLVSKKRAAELLGTMQGGYNIEPLVNLLDSDDTELGPAGADKRRRLTGKQKRPTHWAPLQETLP